PYDFRHHFAYANVERWMRQGKDVTAMLPYLARYMGHASIESSYYYIHTSPDFMHAYAHITAESQSLLPEVWRASRIPDRGPNKVPSGTEGDRCKKNGGNTAPNSSLRQRD
ncbi:MAG TPA: hypothetical protein VE196_14275, partial [Pseudonocardiaceae bacterium]|nr:hypothetical protein [Pseudonocardiaceae bacterium]